MEAPTRLVVTGAGGGGKVLYFDRQGNRALIVERNLRVRAPNGNAALQEGMDQSFASSVLASPWRGRPSRCRSSRMALSTTSAAIDR